jgi:hypothetical protein
VKGRWRNSHCSIGLRHDPRRGALEQLKLRDARRDLRHELDRARTRADHGDPFAFERIAVVPVLRVEGLALEAVEPRNIRQRGPRQAAHARHQHTRRPALAVGEHHLPAVARFVVGGAQQFVAEAKMLPHAETLGAFLQIRTNFRLTREHAAPAGIRRERE